MGSGLHGRTRAPVGRAPRLANLAAYRLDCRLAGFGVTYTRYADDLVFSTDRNLRRLRVVRAAARP
jgi:hypothetical protein